MEDDSLGQALVGLLRAVRDAAPGPQRKLAHQRLWAVLYPRLRRFALARLKDEADAAEAIQEMFLKVERGVEGCAALDGEGDAAGTWSWLFAIAGRCTVDAIRARQGGRKAPEGKDPGLRSGPEVKPEGEASGEMPEGIPLGGRAYAMARRAALRLMTSGEPADLYAEAKAREVTAHPDRLRRDLEVWKRARLQGADALELGHKLGYVGPEARVRGRVAKQAQRGGIAMRLGALAAARSEPDEALRQVLLGQAAVYDKPGSRL